MKLYPIHYKKNAWHIIITWSRPRKIVGYLKKPNDEKASLYMVIHKNKKKVLYVGMTYSQYSIDRIKEHGYKNGLISTGMVEVKWGKHTRQRVKDAESLLIYACNPLENTSKKKGIDLEETLVENKGCRLVPRYLFHGNCIKK